jgi:zinc transporter 9
MAAGGSKIAVGAAIGGNGLVLVAKFAGFAVTGSGAMLSEAVHTLADLLNQILLLVGIVRSERAPDERFQYGYGRVQFVWALISAVGIFFLGCGVTVYHGIHALLRPQPLENLSWAIGVLLAAFVIEGIVLWVAYRQLRAAAAGRPFLSYLRTEADPSAVAVLLEDAAACVGVLIALGCILLTRLTEASHWDAVGSIAIGLMLGAVAVWLIMRNKALLVGPSLPAAVRERVRQIVGAHPAVREVVEMKSTALDAETYDVTLSVIFDGRKLAGQDGPTDALRQEVAEMTVRILGQEIDAIERAVQAEFPQIKHLDVEPH